MSEKDKIVNHIQRKRGKKKAIETLHSTATFTSLSSSPERQRREPRLASGEGAEVHAERCGAE